VDITEVTQDKDLLSILNMKAPVEVTPVPVQNSVVLNENSDT
jgi:hypothetical protein